MKITEHFTLEEMISSAVAKRDGIVNTPSKKSKSNIIALCKYVLEPIREAWGSAIIVTSGYRCPELNAKIGGAKTSQHTRGMAADIKPANGDTLGLWNAIKRSGVKFDQLIKEHPDKNGVPSWIHISYKADGTNRNQILTIV